MRTLHEIAADIRELLDNDFPVLLCSSAQTPEQIEREIDALGEHSLPAAILFLNSIEYYPQNPVRKIHLSILIADRFHAGCTERTLSAWTLCDRLAALFPMDGVLLNGVFYLPENVNATGEEADNASKQFVFRLLLQE